MIQNCGIESFGLIFTEAIWTHHSPVRCINLSKILHKAHSCFVDENLTKAKLVYICVNGKQIRMLCHYLHAFFPCLFFPSLFFLLKHTLIGTHLVQQ